MIRRRPFHRPPHPRRRPGRCPGLPSVPPRLHQALARANRLMNQGEFAEAARIFGELSERARRNSMPVRSAELALRASRAHFATDDVTAALDWARKGLRRLALAGRVERVSRVLSRILNALRGKGYNGEADRLERDIAQVLQEREVSLDEVRQRASQAVEGGGPSPSRTLPARCDGCGAPLVPDVVEWHDALTAECIYCGTIAKTT